jgi:hypothetical protein
MKKPSKVRIDVGVFLGRSLLEGEGLRELQAIICQIAPRCAAGLRICEPGTPEIPIDVKRSGSLSDAVKSHALKRGPRYEELVREFGAGPYERQNGVAELHGSDDSIIIVVSLDEWVFIPSSGRWLFGNRISIQVDAAQVEGEDASLWSRRSLGVLCERLSPIWAKAHTIQEYASKNISREGGGMEAVGLDVSKHLPGIYWLNFFGKPYCDLIGQQRLLTCPAESVQELDNGVFISLSTQSTEWDTEWYRDREAQIIEHLGGQYFFDRRNPTRTTVAPPFQFPVLPVSTRADN